MTLLVRRGTESFLLDNTQMTAFRPRDFVCGGQRFYFKAHADFRVWDAEVGGLKRQAEIVFGSGAVHLRLIPLSDVQSLVRIVAPRAETARFDELCSLAGLPEDLEFSELISTEVGEAVEWFPLALPGGAMESRVVAAIEDAETEATGSQQILALVAERKAKLLLPLQHNLRNEAAWFSNPARYFRLPMAQFVYSLLTANQRIIHSDVKAREPDLASQAEGVVACSGESNSSAPPMFTQFRLRDLTLVNRVIVSPMCMYSAHQGAPNDFHMVHIGARALGGAGLVFTEMTAVSADGRISPGCAGIFRDDHVAGWQRIVQFVHTTTAAKIGLQLGHAGPKASTQVGWERADEPLAEGNWPIIAASGMAFGPANQTPRPMNDDDFDRIELEYKEAARRAERCGFDAIELHFAHGYLLSSFISPLTNKRSDLYGGSLENRLRFPLRVFHSVRRVWAEAKPITIRISACDWVEGGIDAAAAVEIARTFKEAGADAISVSTGQTTRSAKPLYGRQYQVPFSDRIRQEAGIATIAVGAITTADEINTIIAAGRADLCALARPHLVNPSWTLQAAVEQGYVKQRWPKQYLAGKAQAERQRQKAAI